MDAARLGTGEVDPVDPDPHAGDDLEPRQGFDHHGRTAMQRIDGDAAHAVGDGLQEGGLVRRLP